MCITLKVYVADAELKEKYRLSIAKHNEKMCSAFPDAGFDLFCPESYDLLSRDTMYKIDLRIKCAAFDKFGTPLSYYLYPRSSISKTQFRLANGVGIIDSGYRGNIMCMIDIINNVNDIRAKYGPSIEKHSRLFQLCSPTLSPIHVIMVDSEDELGITERGSGGFGSTGK